MTNHRDTGAPASCVYHQGQWRPVTAELLRTILTEPVGPPAVGGYDVRRWGSAASSWQRGQQHVRTALGFVGDAPDMDSPELFDRVADTVPQIAADLCALAHRLGFDPGRLGLAAPAVRSGPATDPIPADADRSPAEAVADGTNSTTDFDDRDKDR